MENIINYTLAEDLLVVENVSVKYGNKTIIKRRDSIMSKKRFKYCLYISFDL